MMRTFVCAVFALVICAGGLLADEVKGKVKKVNADSGTITVTVGDKDQEFAVAKDAKILAASGKDLKEGLKDKHIKEGTEVVITCEKKDGKETATKITLAQPRPKK